MSEMFDSTVSIRHLLDTPAKPGTERCEISELLVTECACVRHRNSVDDWTPPTRHTTPLR